MERGQEGAGFGVTRNGPGHRPRARGWFALVRARSGGTGSGTLRVGARDEGTTSPSRAGPCGPVPRAKNAASEVTSPPGVISHGVKTRLGPRGLDGGVEGTRGRRRRLQPNHARIMLPSSWKGGKGGKGNGKEKEGEGRGSQREQAFSPPVTSSLFLVYKPIGVGDCSRLEAILGDSIPFPPPPPLPLPLPPSSP